MRIRRRIHALVVALVIGAFGVILAACASGAPSTERDTSAGATASAGGGSRLRPVIHRGVHLPPPGSSAPVPLVIALHGNGATPAGFQSTRFNSFADQYGFVVAYLDSTQPFWKAPSNIAYIGSEIRRLTASQNIDPQRVYVTGFSLGGYGTYRAACTLSTQIAAIATVSQVMAPLWRKPCHLARPIPELNIVGSNEAFPVHPAAGYPVSADQTAAIWRQLDGCTSQSQTTHVGPTVQTLWTQCNDGVAVGEYVVIGGTHAWPEPGHTGPDGQYDATAAVWNFLSQFRAAPLTGVAATLSSVTTTGGSGPRRIQVAFDVVVSSIRVYAVLTRGSRVVKSKSFKLRRGTTSTFVLGVPKHARAGYDTLTLKLVDPYGQQVTVAQPVQIPA